MVGLWVEMCFDQDCLRLSRKTGQCQSGRWVNVNKVDGSMSIM